MLVAIADTHAVIWYLYGDKRLSADARQFIQNAAAQNNTIGIAAITLIEMVYLTEKGRIAVESFSQLMRELHDETSVFVVMPLDAGVARAMTAVSSSEIPEMPDRIIAATAYHHGVSVISRDSKIQASNVPTIW